MKLIDLLNKRANIEALPKLIKITWLDYEVEYYLDEDLWYSDIMNDEKLNILPSTLNVEVKVITNEYKRLVQIKEEKEIEKLSIQQVGYQETVPNTPIVRERDIRDIVIDFNEQNRKMCKKINELIREVNKLKKEGK